MEEKLINDILDRAKQNLVNSHGNLAPALFLPREGQLIAIPASFKNNEEKSALLQAAGIAAKKYGCEEVAFLCDAAMKTYKDVDPNELDVTERPLTYPKSMRQECLIFTILEMKTSAGKMYIIPYKEVEDDYVFEQMQTWDSAEGGIKDNILLGYNAE